MLRHGRHFLFFPHIIVYRILNFPPGTFLSFRQSLFFASALLIECLVIEAFWWEIDRARFWPWLHDLALLLHLPVLALLSIILVLLFPAADFLQLLMDLLILLFLFLALFPIRRTKFDGPPRVVSRKTGITEVAFCFLIFKRTHAWTQHSGVKGLANLFHPWVLLVAVIWGEEIFLDCRLVLVNILIATVQLAYNLRKHLI